MRKAIAFACLLQLFFVGAVRAQSNRATITGTVTDSTGAAVAGVQVIVKDLGTSALSTTETNEDGLYTVPNLFPGKFSLEFKKDGFKPVDFPSVTLESTQVAQINAALQLGAVTENITVTADAPVLDRESVAIGTNMKGDVVTDLPLSIYGGGRFVENFAVAITPGYSPISSPYGAVVNGGQWFTKDYTIDGTSGTSSIRGDSMETGPSMEAVQEVQAQTSGIDSASAITSGGVMSFTIKSGTNKFHGSAFGYGHNEFLDANTWQNDFDGTPKAKARAWDYGGSVGGPIFRDKLFFFGTFERYTQNDFTLGGFSGFVPTSQMLSGDFSAQLGGILCQQTDGSLTTRCDASMGDSAVNVKNTNGATVPLQQNMIFDPTTCDANGANCEQFAGNKIDSGRFSSVAQKINAIFQKSYAPERADLTSNNRITQSNSPAQTPNQAVIKLDYDLNSRDKFSGSWIYNNRPRTLVDGGGVWEQGSTDGGPLSAARIQRVKSYQYRFSESHSFGSNFLNVFNETYNWYGQTDTPASSGTDWNSQLGFGVTGADNFPSISFGNAINGQGVTFIGNGSQGSSSGATFITGDTATWITGRHIVSFGGDFRAYQANSHTGSGAINFNFVPNTTDGGFTGVAGSGFASYLLGTVTNAGQSTAFDLYGRRKVMTLFAQDSYKVSPKLTITGGLRWQYARPYHEKYGHWANYDLGQIDPNFGYPGKLTFATGPGDSFEKKEYWDGLGPQLGVAYALRPRLILRGSFSLTLLPTSGPYFNGVPNGFAPGFKGTNLVNNPFNWNSGYPGVFVPGNKNADFTSVGLLTYVDPHSLMPAFTDAMNFGVQYELTPNMRLEVAYVGSRGHHLPDTALAWNEPTASTFLNVVNANPGLVPYGDFSSWNFAGGCTKGQPIPDNFGFGPGTFVGITCPYTGFSSSALAALAPSPQLAALSTNNFYYWLNYVGLPIGQTSYNSMVVEVVKRTGHGLTMDMSYTYSRTRGDTFSAQQEYNGAYTGVQDFGNLSAAADSLTGYDLTHIVKGYITYELPFGRRRRWLADSRGVVNALVGGWQLSGLLLYTSGQPFRIGVNEPFYPVWGNFYPNFHPSAGGSADPHAFQGGTGAPILHYYPAGVATSPIDNGVVAFGSGQAYSSALRCPGSANENASALKYFSMGADGRYQLSLRVEFYNLFNRHSYSILGCGGTGTNIGDTNFAQVTGVNSSPRTGQFGVRFTF
ncbi:MAG: carboxypeptidase regulatory-like domain-containing protein [Candidatus Acidiferrum sp.]